MASSSKVVMRLEIIPAEVLDRICLFLPAPDFHTLAFKCTNALYHKMAATIRGTLMHRVIQLFSPASIRAAIALVRFTSLYHPAHNNISRPLRETTAMAILDELGPNGSPVPMLLAGLTDTELLDLMWLQHVVDMFTTRVMNVIVADSAAGIRKAAYSMIDQLVLGKQADKLKTEPLLNTADALTGLTTGISATEVARAERGFLHSELLLFASLVDHDQSLGFAQHLPKWEFKELLTAQELYKLKGPARIFPDGQNELHQLVIELDRLYHRQTMVKICSRDASYKRFTPYFRIWEHHIGLLCQDAGYDTDAKLFDRTNFPNYAWYQYATDFPFRGLFDDSKRQYQNGSQGENELQAWVGFTDSEQCVERRRAGWVFWDKARCFYAGPSSKPRSLRFVSPRLDSLGRVILCYTTLDGRLVDIESPLNFLHGDFGIGWYTDRSQDDDEDQNTYSVTHQAPMQWRD